MKSTPLMLVLKTLVLLAVFLYAGNVTAEPITVVFEEWPPYEFTSNGAVIGTDAEIIKEAAKRLGITLKFSSVPWTRALKSVTNGTAEAIISISKNQERLGFLVYPKTQLNAERKVFFTLKDSKLTIKKFSDLQGLTVGVVRGNSYGKDFDAQTGFKKYETPDQETILKMLVAKRFDAAITSDLVGFDVARKLGVANQITSHPFIVLEAPLYIAFSKAKGPLANDLADKFSKMLAQLKAEGFIDKILASYNK